MILFIVIVVVLLLVFKPRQKEQKEIEKMVTNTPRLYLKGKEVTGWKAFLDLASDAETIATFLYENGYVTITMRNGKRYSSHLSNMAFSKWKQKGVVFYECVFGKERLYSHKMNFVFTDEEWKQIFDILYMSATTL